MKTSDPSSSSSSSSFDITSPKHEESEIEPEERHPCMEAGCSAVLWNRQSLTAHLQSCEFKTPSSSPLGSQGKTNKKTSRKPILTSPPRYKNKSSLPNHGRYHCDWPNCDKILATPKSLKDHKQIHAERNAGIQLKCPIEGCGKAFGTNRCLRAHELRCRQVRSGKRLKCPYPDCKATFGSTDYVRRHALDHEKGLVGIEFNCDFPGCNAKLANPLTLQRHHQLHEEQSLGLEWKCLVPNCGKKYSGSKQLTDHQSRLHKNLNSDYRFPCPYDRCSDVFACQRVAYKHECLYISKKCTIED
ncbi:hypothetical protein BGZ76_002644, partial [Entomortierella beljakovae]